MFHNTTVGENINFSQLKIIIRIRVRYFSLSYHILYIETNYTPKINKWKIEMAVFSDSGIEKSILPLL